MRRRFASLAAVSTLLIGCIPTELQITDTRARRDGEQVVVEVDVKPNTDDVEGYCVRVTFWNEDTQAETWMTCGGELDQDTGTTMSFETKLGGGSCTAFAIETRVTTDEDQPASIESPPERKPRLPVGAIEQPCP